MKRFQFNQPYKNGQIQYKAGAVIAISDSDAAKLTADGVGCAVADDTPLLKQGADLMLNCSTPSAKKAAKKAAPPPEEVATVEE